MRTALLSPFWPLYRQWRLFILRAGRDSLQRRDPCSPELARIVVELRDLERSA